MFLHNPAEFPRVKTEYFRIPVNRDVVVGIRPNVMLTSKVLSSYSPEWRQCYYSKERPLHYFQYYNERNCEMECFTNFTIKTCECAAFYMPRRLIFNLSDLFNVPFDRFLEYHMPFKFHTFLLILWIYDTEKYITKGNASYLGRFLIILSFLWIVYLNSNDQVFLECYFELVVCHVRQHNMYNTQAYSTTLSNCEELW